MRSYDSREQSATYELVVSNKSDVDISCRLYGMDAGSYTREFGMLTIAKRSAGSSFFSVPLEMGDRRRTYVEVFGEGVHLFAEALQPKARANVRWPKLAIACVVVTSATALGATYLLEKPSVEALSVPTSARPGIVTAMFAIGGRATVRYRASMSDGTVFAKGNSSASSGNIAIRVPANAAGRIVRFSLDASGPLGRAVRTVSFRVVRDPSGENRTPSGVASFGKHPQTHSPRSSAVVASYRPRAQSAVDTPRLRSGDAKFEGMPAFSVSGHPIAGRPFTVSIAHPLPQQRIIFKDGLEAIVADVAVSPKASNITLLAPASPTVEMYHLVSTFRRGNRQATVARALRIDPR